eukprot:765910-Hanusia_phi.AAC.1
MTLLTDDPPPPEADPASHHFPRKRALTPSLASDIFAQRSLKPGYVAIESSFVARQYGVSSKTVRDIWSRRSWAKATRPLWTVEEQQAQSTKQEQGCESPATRQPGRQRPRSVRRVQAPSSSSRPLDKPGSSLTLEDKLASSSLDTASSSSRTSATGELASCTQTHDDWSGESSREGGIGSRASSEGRSSSPTWSL